MCPVLLGQASPIPWKTRREAGIGLFLGVDPALDFAKRPFLDGAFDFGADDVANLFAQRGGCRFAEHGNVA